MIKDILVYECDLCGRHEEIKGPKIRKAIPELPKRWKRAWLMVTFTKPDSQVQAIDKIHLCPCCSKSHKRIKVRKKTEDEYAP